MIRAWISDAAGTREAPAIEAARLAAAGTASVWIDLDTEDDASARAALGPLGIHPLVLDDMVQQVNRPKVDHYGTYLYLVMHSARWEGERPTLRELDIVLGDRFLVTYHDGSTRSIAAAHEILTRQRDLLGSSPAHLLHYILDVLLDHYLPIMDRIGEEIDALEEWLVEKQTSLALERVVRLKRGMAAMRRIVGPQRDTLLALTRDEFRAIPADLRPYLRDLYDRLARVSDLLDSFRDEVTSLLELNVSMVSNRVNEVIKRLTVIATVGLPLTVITSYYGMNFAFPEYQYRHPAVFVLSLLGGTGLLTWWLLKRSRWL